MEIKLTSQERLNTQPHFESEGFWNSEVAYFREFFYTDCVERESRYVRVVVMVAKFLDDNHNRKFTQKVNSHCFKLYRSYSISFNLSNVGEIFWIEFQRTVSKFRKQKKETFCLSFTYSVKRARENRKFDVVVVQGWLKNVQKSVVQVQSFCFTNINSLFLPFSVFVA